MDERAVECIGKWRFKPGTKDGSPVDVASRIAFSFGLTPQPRMWGAGPLPTAKCEPGDEIVLLEFTVSSTGEVVEIQPLEGEESKSLSSLTSSLSSWKFAAASNGTGPVAAKGKVLFIKGEDQFRYQISKTFRDSGGVHPNESKPVSSPDPAKSIMTIKVPIRIDLEPSEAMKQLIDHVSPDYPAEAMAAHVQGTVSLLITIGKDGSVTDVKEISGPPELTSAARSFLAASHRRQRP